MKRYGIFRIVGSGTIPDPYRSEVDNLAVQGQANATSLIPSNQDGTPKYRFAFSRAAASNFLPVQLLTNSYIFPDYPLDAQMSGMDTVTRNAMIQSVQAYDMDGAGLHLDASHTDAESYGAVVDRIAKQVEPQFNVNNFDTTEPT